MKRGFVFSLVLILSNLCLAQADDIELGKIVITGSRYFKDVNEISQSVDVITSDEITATGAQNIIDVLRISTGLNVQDYYGTGVKATVDLRGFGETAASNALVLVDGRRVNEIDLSGVDWSQISLDQIERIEVLHGPATVLYGDNATGGVINIITKKGSGKLKLSVDASGGSYSMNKQIMSIDGSLKDLAYSIRASRNSTDGYRKNSHYDTKDFSGRLNYYFTDILSLDFSGSYHDADFGLPGALTETDLQTTSRRDAKFPNDDVSEKDWYVMLTPGLNLQDKGNIETNISFRRRQVNSAFGTYSLIFHNSIDTVGITPKYTLKHKIFEKDNEFILGMDFYKIDLSSGDFTNTGTQTGISSVNKKSLAGYLQDNFFILDKLIFDLGFRWESAQFDFDYTDLSGWYTNIDDSRRFNEQAYKSGLVYNYKKDSKAYINISSGYRLPVVDEFILYNFWVFPFGRTINKDLKPQKVLNYEAGVEHSWNDNLKTGISFYWMKIKDEIYYDPYIYLNGNYDRTLHRGVNFKLDSKISQRLHLFCNYSFTKANFDGGMYAHNDLPFVAEHKVAAGLGFDVTNALLFSVVLNYTGPRRFMSDMMNTGGWMEDYVTVDTKLSYKYKNIKAYFGINNLFGEEYSEIGSFISSVRSYYLSPGRNIFGGLSLEF